MFWWKKDFQDFQESYRFQRRSTCLFILFIISVPITQIARYLIEKEMKIDEGFVSWSFLIRIYPLVCTLLAATFTHCMAQNFKEILPCDSFPKAIPPLLFLMELFHILVALSR